MYALTLFIMELHHFLYRSHVDFSSETGKEKDNNAFTADVQHKNESPRISKLSSQVLNNSANTNSGRIWADWAAVIPAPPALFGSYPVGSDNSKPASGCVVKVCRSVSFLCALI